jgi:hypothetical protein
MLIVGRLVLNGSDVIYQRVMGVPSPIISVPPKWNPEAPVKAPRPPGLLLIWRRQCCIRDLPLPLLKSSLIFIAADLCGEETQALRPRRDNPEIDSWL